MSNSNLTRDEIRARRKALAEEDRMLASIEAHLDQAEAQWAAYRQAVLANLDNPAKAPLPLIGGSAATATTVRPAGGGGIRKRTNLPPQRARTKNELIIEALNAPRELWQTANQVQAYMTGASEKEVPMSSVSPALTALKNNGTIVRRDMRVALTLRVEREEPGFLNEKGEPDGSPDAGGSSAASDQPQQPGQAHEGR